MNYHMYEIPNTTPKCPPEGHYVKVYGYIYIYYSIYIGYIWKSKIPAQSLSPFLCRFKTLKGIFSNHRSFRAGHCAAGNVNTFSIDDFNDTTQKG